MNNTITLLDDDTKQESVLYKPVKSLVPMIFPNILDASKDESSENEA